MLNDVDDVVSAELFERLMQPGRFSVTAPGSWISSGTIIDGIFILIILMFIYSRLRKRACSKNPKK